MSQKPHRIYVVVKDGKPREPNKLKSQLVPHVDVVDAGAKVAFFIHAVKESHFDQVRPKLAAAGLEEAPLPERPDPFPKPYGFVAIPQTHTTSAPIWHDGTSSAGRLSGEIRFELETLTPLLVGWERGVSKSTRSTGSVKTFKEDKGFGFIMPDGGGIDVFFHISAMDDSGQNLSNGQKVAYDIEQGQRGPQAIRIRVSDDSKITDGRDGDWPLPQTIDGVGKLADKKSVLCPLRAPWGERPVVIPGDSLKGLLRHELGALLGAPMERVAERSYSYRPNALYPLNPQNRFLVPRLARVLKDHIETKPLDDSEHQARVPTRVELFPAELQYNKKTNKFDYRFDQPGGEPYRGGQGAGQKLNSKPKVHTTLKVLSEPQSEPFDVPKCVQDGYLATVRHLVDLDHGHFSERHPDVPKAVTGDSARDRILTAAKDEVFQPGDLIWVEWDAEKKCIVSLGWHYYYRWAYTDSIRKTGGNYERHGLFPLDAERETDSYGAPKELSPVRRLFGYTGDNEGSAGIGEKDHSQMMGRVFVNAGLEVVGENASDDDRFLKPTFIRELGMPRPSAVEHYLKQPHHPQSRLSDNATLVTYGDAAGYDAPGEIAGRKFYLDRKDAYDAEGKGLVPGPAADHSEVNKQNERSTLAIEATKPSRKFRFTVRFRDLDATELAAIIVALCPDQFKCVLGGTHADGYCSKLGYARPLGWGSVRIEAKALLLLDETGDSPTLNPVDELSVWVMSNHERRELQDEWLAIHRRNHPNAADYPLKDGQIFSFHTDLRAQHSRKRRYKKG